MTPALDKRQSLILNIAAAYLDDTPDRLGEKVIKVLNIFLDTPTVTTLAILKKSDAKEVLCTINISDVSNNIQKGLVFFKLNAVVITESNMQESLHITSLVDSPLASLYGNIHKVFSPVILQRSRVSPKFQELLGELETGLVAILNRPRSGNLRDQERLAAILEPLDELSFWRELAGSASGAESTRAKIFASYLEPIEQIYVNSVSLGELSDNVDTLTNFLDDLWKQAHVKPPYPQARMRHLLDTVGITITTQIQESLRDSLWTMRYDQLRIELEVAIDICLKWQDACQKHTGIFWPQEENQWKGAPFVPTYVVGFTQRLLQIQSLRTIHNQLSSLARSSLKDDPEVFAPLMKIDAVHFNPATQQTFDKAVIDFEHHLSAAEKAAAIGLKKLLKEAGNNIDGVLSIINRYKDVAVRPQVVRELTAERENMVVQMNEHVSHLRREYDNRMENEDKNRIAQMPTVVNNVIWGRHLESKAR
ncbi:cytoplasmic dynein 2 heavy chain 1-like [Galendromus occidentalis]|uniref:Cytoplasmic dynein 2 heavy chain 1-like n=1 Tax=Galendromus occidentalis TaxID=34638 RepID=A0AAJ7SHC7_9ACAR|nr:cytoplasmic dynein 2 heavy chain 1-like [Galendromus occidentalis]